MQFLDSILTIVLKIIGVGQLYISKLDLELSKIQITNPN